jgi:hypothetical protein
MHRDHHHCERRQRDHRELPPIQRSIGEPGVHERPQQERQRDEADRIETVAGRRSRRAHPPRPMQERRAGAQQQPARSGEGGQVQHVDPLAGELG